ncbi:MAG: hypothetical protein RIC04_07980 [Parvibaculum sp.]|uniref:hypothetical protein n=1 Tax=Parvibaculum sp. TaxID=2024848 RepID=UPI0032EACC19
MSSIFRHSAGFGRRIEYWIIGRMLKDGLDVYVPLVDDDGIDAIVRKNDGTIIEFQIKARSNTVKLGSAGLFAAIQHETVRPNYYFVLYSERMDKTWVISSAEFIRLTKPNKNGKNAGKRTVWLNGTKLDKNINQRKEYPNEKFSHFLVDDFSKFRT